MPQPIEQGGGGGGGGGHGGGVRSMRGGYACLLE